MISYKPYYLNLILGKNKPEFMLVMENISKNFTMNDSLIKVLEGISITVNEGEKIAIVGPSGSGKSTLLSIMSGMDKPDSGKVLIDNENIVSMNENNLCTLRNQKIGIVFQSFELIPSFTALENVMLPLDIAEKKSLDKAKEVLEELGLKDRENHLPKELSGGEQQRVAIGRALVNDPKIIFADEPTGNLDIHTGRKVVEIFFRQIEKYKKTLILITHDISLAKKMDRIFSLKEGKLFLENAETFG